MLEAFTKGTSFASSPRTIVPCNGEHMTAKLLRCLDGYTRLPDYNDYRVSREVLQCFLRQLLLRASVQLDCKYNPILIVKI